ncbi:MAG: hypothetical protein EA376_09390, partial [Phycisphaeraceae bacterium]
SSTGEEGNDHSLFPSISADGRFVAFYSDANSLVSGDTNDATDAFVHDRQTGVTERVSVSSTGVQGNNNSFFPSISADGRFVAFHSEANNLVTGDSNDASDVFVHDRQTGVTERVSVSSSGEQSNGDSWNPSISADGRLVAFMSEADNLVPNDTNDTWDVFVHDRQTGVTERVSVSTAGEQGNLWSGWPSISANGRFVAFESLASNLVPDDMNDIWDIFVHDRQAGRTELISVSSSGEQGNLWSAGISISADGRYVAFGSESTNLVPGDTNGFLEAFVRDRLAGVTERVNVSYSGEQANGATWSAPSISADGRFVAFDSAADNLVPGVTNDTANIFIRDRGAPDTCPWDLTGSGSIGAADLAGVLGCWGRYVPGDSCHVADFTNTGDVGSADLANLLGNWGPCP